MPVRILIILFIAALMIGCQSPKEPKVPQMDFEGLETWLNKDTDTVYVINFWATWCKPCIEELPDFEKLNHEYGNEKVKVILVSLDFPKNHEEQLLPYLEANNIKTEVIHLTDVNANKWINKVDPSWSGAIPATIIYKRDSRQFYERKMNYDELKSIVELKLNTNE